MPPVAQRPLTPLQVRGQRTYDTVCWVCHGLYGHGDGPGAKGFPAGLPDLGLALAGTAPEGVIGRLSSGRTGSDVSAWHSLPREQLRAALAYANSFAHGGTRGDPAGGRLIYGSYCIQCHGTRGAGDGRLARASDRRPADLRRLEASGRMELAFRTIRAGTVSRHSRYMPYWGWALSDEQIKDVVAYLRVLQVTR